MPFANGKEGRIYWRADGSSDAPPLLLLNSLGTEMGMWDDVVPLLTEKLRVIRMDTRGHGASDVVKGDYTIPSLAEDALAVLDAAGAEKAYVCGLSLGGMMAMRLAMAAPGRVAKVIACNTSAEVPSQPWVDRVAVVRKGGMSAIVDAVMQRFFSDGFRAAATPRLATLRSTFLSISPVGYTGCCMAISQVAMLGEIPSIKAPLLVVNGSLDTATPPADHGDRIVAAVPGAKVVSLEAGHISSAEKPKEFAKAVLDFVK